MKHFSAEKYNLAWFKLAECVSRGEKERALGVYRLLLYSVGDDALSTQLYADILLSFGDKIAAIEKYLEAIIIYKKENKIIEAIAVYEHLLFLQPNCYDYVAELCCLYLKSNLEFKVIEHLDKLISNKKVNNSQINNSLSLSDFLEKLKAIDEDSYNYVLQYLE